MSSVGDSLLNSIPRATQRAPRSCTWCSSRKSKCDKKIPCSACIKRGAAATCTRETVLVRGVVTTATERRTSYEELRTENMRLKRRLTQLPQTSITHSQERRGSPPPGFADSLGSSQDIDSFECLLLTSAGSRHPTTRDGTFCVELPSRSCSLALLRFGELWHSWVHFALDFDRFELEHESFWTVLSEGRGIEDHEPLWLAIYFSFLTATLLTMDQADMEAAGLLRGDQERLLRSWYKSALHFLYRGDFMGSPDIRTVQAIAILGMCFFNFGDSELCKTMYSVAIRTAQGLGMHDPQQGNKTGLSVAHASRLWWTLVIDEWMAPSTHPPCVSEDNFDVPMSLLLEEDDNPNPEEPFPEHQKPSIVHYHIAMSQIARVYYRFARQVRQKHTPLIDLVRTADESLAELITNLPQHLRADEAETEETRVRNLNWPWVPWQQHSIKLVLLYHRLSINRHLQREWLAVPGLYSGQRAICLEAAKAIIQITSRWHQATAYRRQWALSAHVFAAGMCLIIESKDSRDEAPWDFTAEIGRCMDYLEQIKTHNAIARRGIEIMSSLMNKSRHESLGPRTIS